ncbi:MAG: hypothetical protein J5790_07190 [Bacteroidaceae bacterium]|nr:hypothetical protein [Bacteroidaceae bacterium]
MKKALILLIMLAGVSLLQAQVRRTPVQRTQTQQRSTAQTTTRAFTLANGKLGPIQTGQRFVNIPATYAGLYDKYTYRKEEMGGEGGDEWIEEYYQFTKAGKKVFRALISEGKIISIELQEGSASIIKTQEGYYVGYPARTLFTKKRMEWITYYEGTSFATSGHYTYYVNSDDLIDIEPTNVNHFKPNAKVCMISYNLNVETY